MQIKSVAVASEILAISHIGLAPPPPIPSLLLQLLALQQISRLGGNRCTVTHSAESVKKKKVIIIKSFTISVAYATTNTRSSEQEAETIICNLIPRLLG